MNKLSWIGVAISSISSIINPWLAAYGMTIIFLIVIVHSVRDVKVAYIKTNPVVKPDKVSKKHNKKNR